jgi:glycosyltransferase involved in cell wall biosynthesis
MAQLIAAADVVAVPSEMDNLPMTACEAQTAGRPVVAFDVGGLPDIVTHLTTGYLARAYDVTDLADGLSQALDEARTGARWGAAARTNAQSRWSAAAVVDQYLRVYEQAVSGFGGDRGR